MALVATLGWPLPRAVPAWTEIRGALEGGGVSDRTILKAIACVVWIAWFQVGVSAALELTHLLAARSHVGCPAYLQACKPQWQGSWPASSSD